MYLHDGAIQGHGLNLDLNNLLGLENFKNPLQHPAFTPPIEPGVDTVPVPKALWQPSPLAALLGHVKHRIEQRKVRNFHVPALHGQRVFNLFELRRSQFHVAF